MPAREQITGVILAGGEGKRMGGVDKGLEIFRDRPLIEHVIERLRPQVDQLLISANRNLDQYREYGFPLVQDQHADRYGPLAGVLAAMQSAKTHYVVTAPCDTPALPLDLVERLGEALMDSGADICAVSIGGRLEPAFQFARTELAGALEDYLESGERRAMRWITLQKSCVVEFDDSSAFLNLNTREELIANE